ncbi:MAG: hypothetical protein KAX38_06675, partial [Candidatus Krumholzibacteria bacterium]|nr:hypothetical protein [Candidatus Krumholzibacteria bacterium]
EDLSYSYEEFDSTAVWEFSLPAAYSMGVAVGLTDRWWLTSSYWSREAPDPVGFPQFVEGSLSDERLIAFGIERRRAEGGGFFSRMPIRVGFYENRWHLKLSGSQSDILNPVKGRFFTIGTGFPLPGGPGSIDFSLEFGQIGSIDDNGLDEKIMRFGLGLSVSESWMRRKEGRR